MLGVAPSCIKKVVCKHCRSIKAGIINNENCVVGVSGYNSQLLKDRRRAKITDVAREFDIAHSVVSRLWKSFKTTGMCSRRRGGGRVRSTTPAEDRYIVLSAKRNRRTTAQQVANQFLAASGKQISRKTVARRLRGRRTIRTRTCCLCPIDQTAPYRP
ncbi:hypothetical protein TNCV_2261821 [Trichonephila clavipes]|nr:hypothetical protein TNCV_2261821 [Trichonephila clavipes]